jgi:hypothetical protein
MSKTILDLGNSSNWQPLWFGSFTAMSVPDKPAGYTYPIPPILVPVLLDDHIIAITAESDTAKPTWKLAGKLLRKIQTGITIGAVPDVATSDPRKFYLNQINLFIFREISSTYAVEITPQWYLRDIRLSTWIYTGVNSDTVTEQLNRIELAIDNFNR